MNNYIVLDTKKYKCPKDGWQPIIGKPTQVRYNLDGTTDITYGPAVPYEWIGQIIAPNTPFDGGWGSYDDLMETLAKTEDLAFVDHYGNAYTVVALGPIVPLSKSPMWDAPSNEYQVQTRLVRVYA